MLKEEFEQLIDELLYNALLNLECGRRSGTLVPKYRTGGMVYALQALESGLKNAGLVRQDYNVPSLKCLECVVESWSPAMNPNHRCPSSDPQSEPLLEEVWSKCRARADLNSLLKRHETSLSNNSWRSTIQNVGDGNENT